MSAWLRSSKTSPWTRLMAWIADQTLADLGRALLSGAGCLEVEQAGDDLEVVAGLVMDFLDQGVPVRQGRLQVRCALIDLPLQRTGQVVELLIALRQTVRRDFQILQSDAKLLFGIQGFGPACGETGFQQTDHFLIP